ncbi:MAG: hypothetical protein QMD06_01805 [Candidatus Altarchaeum sp.]|nr:hypothetical protein [Candidatus Altarchaeum sp.]
MAYKILFVSTILGLIFLNIYAIISYNKLNKEKNKLLINLKLSNNKIELYDNESDLLNSDFNFIKNIIDSNSNKLINIKDVNIFLFFTKDDCNWCLTPLFSFMEENYFLSKQNSMSFVGIEIVQNIYDDTYPQNKYSFSFQLLIDKYSLSRSHLNKLPTPFILVTDDRLLPMFTLCGDHRFNSRIKNIETKIKRLIERN